MRPIRYSIDTTPDGCCHHEAGLPPDEESMRHWTAGVARADALLLGRVTLEMVRAAWRRPVTGSWPDGTGEWQVPFAEAVDRSPEHVVSSTLSGVDGNAELVRADAAERPALARPARARGPSGVPVGGARPAVPALAGPGLRARVLVRRRPRVVCGVRPRPARGLEIIRGALPSRDSA